MKIDSFYKMGRTEVEASTSVLPFYITVTLANDGCSYVQKHVVMHVMNK
jgi:hypothetical protein